MLPETRYARSGDVNIAYQVVGDAPRDLVLVPGWVSNIEVFWEHPTVARFLQRLASFARLILFDKRGTGLSDRLGALPNLETRMDDVRAVLDAVGSERAALFGYSEGGGMCALFAATYPARTSGLIMYGSYARLKPAHDHPWARSAEVQARWLETIQRDWGGPVGLDIRAPSQLADDSVRQWWARFLRMGASPAAAAELSRMSYEIDIRHLLPAVRVPTLVLHTSSDRTVDIGASRYIAELIPGAKLVELAGVDHLPWGDGADRIVDEIEEFRQGSGTAPSSTASLPPCSSPTSSVPRRRRPPSGIDAGATSSRVITASSARSSAASAAARSTPRATGFWPPSTGPRGGSAAPAR
jgi:pimeloyl-ACP methyl ester carboxylesterase